MWWLGTSQHKHDDAHRQSLDRDLIVSMPEDPEGLRSRSSDVPAGLTLQNIRDARQDLANDEGFGEGNDTPLREEKLGGSTRRGDGHGPAGAAAMPGSVATQRWLR